MTPVQLLTSGKLAEELNAPVDRVRRVLATRPHIKPVARAGLTRLYTKEAMEAVRAELEAMAARGGEAASE